MFGKADIVIREICNGALFLSAVALVVVFAFYIKRARREMPDDWHKDIGVHAAFAAVVLMSGHSLRALGSWAQFFYLHLGIDESFWGSSSRLFLVATALILSGKLLMVYTFSCDGKRGLLTAATAAASLIVPVAVALAASIALVAWQF